MRGIRRQLAHFHAPWDEWVGVYEALRAEFARFINAEPDEVAIVTSASAGINPIANALSFDRRNQVVMGEYEFPTMGHIWLAQRPRGAEVQFLDGVGERRAGRSATSAPSTSARAIVPLTQVSFVNGFRSDVAAITRIAHSQRRPGVPRWLPGLRHAPHGRQSAGRGFLRDRHAEVSAGPARPGVSLRAARADRNAHPHHDQLDVAARRLRVRHPAPGSGARGTALRKRHAARSPTSTWRAPPCDLLARVGMENVAAQIERAGARVHRRARAIWASTARRPPIPWGRWWCCAPRCARAGGQARGARHRGLGAARTACASPSTCTTPWRMLQRRSPRWRRTWT